CNFACETGAKANSAFRTVPAAVNSGNLRIALNSYIFRIDVDPTTKLATQVRYYDSAGNVHIQPGKVFHNGLWGLNIYRIEALSGIGNQYNPATVTGSSGRGWLEGYAPYAGTSASGTVDIGGNAYPAGNASGGGTDVFDFADDNFDHTGLNFIGGANFSVGGYLGGGPANLSTIGGGYGGAVTPANIGSAYKVKLKDMYLVTKQVVGATPFAPDIPTTQKYADLDPHHTDMYGDPLTRLTADWVANNYNGATYIAKSFVLPLLQKLGASDAALSTAVNPGPDPVNPGPANIDWWGHHQRGSMRTGSDPSWSVYNKYMQSWSLENLFASGEICNTFGTYVTAGTHPAGPLSYVAAEGIQKYLAGPGPLV
ncbi:MAG: hypothetical protein ABSA72_13180, partial [Nitrososphaerales archaeon]